jgi:hypothetical protein
LVQGQFNMADSGRRIDRAAQFCVAMKFFTPAEYLFNPQTLNQRR